VADQSAWVRWAYLEHHAGRLSMDEVTAVVQRHRASLKTSPDDTPPSDIAITLDPVLRFPPDE